MIGMKHTVGVLVTGLALASFMGAATAAEPPPSGSQDVWSYLNNLPAEERLAVLEEKAREDGKLVIYGALGTDRAAVLIEPFSKLYPEIEVDFVRLREPELVERVTTEVRANSVGGDVAISNVAWLEIIKDALGHYVPTSWENFDEDFVFGSDTEGWTAVAYEVLPSTIAWRTDRVSEEEAPTTLEEMADPKWKGRAGTTSHLETMMDGLIDALGEEATMTLIDRLAELDNRLYPSIAALADGLALGEIDVAWNMGAHRPVRLKSEGAPVDFVFQDPLLGLGITVSTIEQAPHSYAAALFMEYLTRAETLEAIDKAEGGRLFGNEEGEYQIGRSTLPKLTLFQAIPPERFEELSRIAEQNFIRR